MILHIIYTVQFNNFFDISFFLEVENMYHMVLDLVIATIFNIIHYINLI